ncbi:XerC Integrase [uncultured Caudovirales phage]|uniref:Integrase n=1 Tax=uncultured Caudovirales phage TaxID=2100421 RepID=A0A6J7WC87_9CAUD|nr:XerC Integrase [uncultured Caudovirales phage]
MYHYNFIVSQGSSVEQMGRKKNPIPTHLIHSTTGIGFIKWSGATLYTSADPVEASRKYHEYCRNIDLFGHPTPPKSTASITTADLAARYHAHVIKTKPPESKEDKPVGVAMRWLATVDCPADQYTPAKLVGLRQQWVDDGQSVSTISKKHNYVLCAFRWAAQMDLVPATVWTSLTTVTKIKPGRSAAKQPRKVHPVSDEHLDAVIPHLKPDVAAAVEFQRLTGCRSAEVLRLTMGQVDGSTYRPVKHKNAWRGKARTIHLGNRALSLIAKWATDDPHRPLFLSMDSAEYGKRIKRACKRAGVPHFSPHQIRHAHGTLVRAKYGLDAAQAALGHSSARTTEIYAEVSQALAKKVSDDIG